MREGFEGSGGEIRFGAAGADAAFPASATALREGRGMVAADARLDNRAELEGRLRIEPPRARAMDDAALVAAAVERWGESAVERLVGDYAFAWWDAPGERLVLARDFLGTRPLAYARGVDAIGFGARIEGGERVPAGHVVTVTRTGAALRRWWRPTPRPIAAAGEPEMIEGLQNRLDEAVRRRLLGVDGVIQVVGSDRTADAVAASASRIVGEGRVRRLGSLKEAAPGVALTAVLGELTIGYSGEAALPAGPLRALGPWLPGVASRALAARLDAIAATDLADAPEAPAGVDVRDPTADRALVEYCVSIPERRWLGGLATRAFG